MIRITSVCRRAAKSSIRCITVSSQLGKKEGSPDGGEKVRTQNAKRKEKIGRLRKSQDKTAVELFNTITEGSSLGGLPKTVEGAFAKGNDGAKQKIYDLIKETESFDVNTEQGIQLTKPAKKSSKRVVKEDVSASKLLTSVKGIAAELGGDTQKTTGELLEAYHAKIADRGAREGNAVKGSNIKNIIGGMDVDQGAEPGPGDTKEFKIQKKSFVRGQQTRRQDKIQMTLHSGQDFGIFEKDYLQKVPDEEEGEQLKFWNHLQQRELLNMGSAFPRNYFEQMIVLMKQGRVWQFPIDNEQGMDEEKETDFTEHIFLDEYLEPWCPPTGPLRHFMDLVIKGLSKNCYLSVAEKKEHIMWFKEYFEKKKQILTELGLLQGRALAES